jgi:hypothetical protein
MARCRVVAILGVGAPRSWPEVFAGPGRRAGRFSLGGVGDGGTDGRRAVRASVGRRDRRRGPGGSRAGCRRPLRPGRARDRCAFGARGLTPRVDFVCLTPTKSTLGSHGGVRPGPLRLVAASRPHRPRPGAGGRPVRRPACARCRCVPRWARRRGRSRARRSGRERLGCASRRTFARVRGSRSSARRPSVNDCPLTNDSTKRSASSSLGRRSGFATNLPRRPGRLARKVMPARASAQHVGSARVDFVCLTPTKSTLGEPASAEGAAIASTPRPPTPAAARPRSSGTAPPIATSH